MRGVAAPWSRVPVHIVHSVTIPDQSEDSIKIIDQSEDSVTVLGQRDTFLLRTIATRVTRAAHVCHGEGDPVSQGDTLPGTPYHLATPLVTQHT